MCHRLGVFGDAVSSHFSTHHKEHCATEDSDAVAQNSRDNTEFLDDKSARRCLSGQSARRFPPTRMAIGTIAEYIYWCAEPNSITVGLALLMDFFWIQNGKAC